MYNVCHGSREPLDKHFQKQNKELLNLLLVDIEMMVRFDLVQQQGMVR